MDTDYLADSNHRPISSVRTCIACYVSTTALFIGMLAGAALFPPALMAVMALSKFGEPHETIIAVDGERTRDVTEFEEAIEKADAGEVVYLTVVSGGRREQIRVALPVQ